MEFSNTNKKDIKLLSERFQYTKHKALHSSIRWRCVGRTRGWKGAVITDGGNQDPRLSLLDLHTPGPALTEVAKFRTASQKTAIETNGPPSWICAKAFDNLQESARARISSEKILQRDIRRHISSVYPPTPASLKDQVIDGVLKTTARVSPEPFLIYDNGS